MPSQIVEPTRVLLVSPLPPPPGGIGTWTEIFLREITKFPKIRIKHIEAAQRRKWRRSQSTFSRLVYGARRALQDIVFVTTEMIVFRPHVLHLTTSAAYASLKDLILLLLARLCGVAGLIHYHTSILACQDVHGWQFRIARLAMFFAARVVVIDSRTYSLLQTYLAPQRVHKVPNMIDLNRIDRLRKDDQQDTQRRIPTEVRCVFAGRVVREKGIVELVEACRPLPGVQLHLVGPVDEPFHKQMQQLAQHRERGQWLHFHGQVENGEACRHILLSDIILLPSYYEGFPIVILEGMALGKPVVATDVGAIAEMIDAQGEHACGVCVPPKDTAALQDALQRLLGRPQQCEEMGQDGRKRVEALYSTKAILEQLEEIWVDMGRCHNGAKHKQWSAKIISR